MATEPFNSPRVVTKSGQSVSRKLFLPSGPAILVDEKAKVLRHLVSTQTVDRDGEVLVSRGVRTEEFFLNPIMLFNHLAKELPVAQCLAIDVTDTEVWSTTKFAGLAQLHEKAETIYRCFRDGFLRAASVGFMVIKSTNEKLFPDQVGRTISQWGVVEISLVGLPSNIYAVTQFAKAFGLPDGATEIDLAQTLGVTPLAKYWSIAEQILPAETLVDRAREGRFTPEDAEWIERTHYEYLKAVADGLATKVMPAPKPDESEDDFVTRCMGNSIMNSDYPNQAQRAAVCHAQFGKGPKKGARAIDLTLPLFAIEPGDVPVDFDPLRWNRDLSAKLFDVTRERNPAVTKEIDLAAKYLDCEVKELTRRELVYHGTRMGAGLVALDEAIGAYDVEDVRNFARGTGEEAPLGHDVIRLNSKLRRSFLLDGTRFMRKAEGRLVCRMSPEWRGVAITVYGKSNELADEFCEQVQTRATTLKFYKGESFSLSGEFLDATDETWDDVFLTLGNEKSLKRVVELVNTHGASMENRGVIMLGPPGSGKTLGSRIMRNETRGGKVPDSLGVTVAEIEPATFIWISARDFYRLGAFGGIEHAFETAKDLAPTILVFEDVDHWIGRGEIDLLKTTMDGVARTKGIVTVLTTNDPAHFPTALIDRPGRFHDVLKIDLPDADQRTRMLARWAPDLSPDAVKATVDGTDGYSGAHVRELARFADIIREQDGVESPDEAIKLALVKVREQRDLIGETHAQQGRYVPRAAVVEAVKAAVSDSAAEVRALGWGIETGHAQRRETPKQMGEFDRAGYVARASEALTAAISIVYDAIHDAMLAGDDSALDFMEIQGELAEELGDLRELLDETGDGASIPEMPTPMGMASLAARMFDAYNEQGANPWKTFDGRDVPRWPELTDQVREKWIAAAGFAVKAGEVLSAANHKKLKDAHAMVGDVISAHEARHPKPTDPTAPETPGQVPHVPAKSLAEEIAAAFNGTGGASGSQSESEIWFDGAFARDLAERLAVHPGPGAAGR